MAYFVSILCIYQSYLYRKKKERDCHLLFTVDVLDVIERPE